MGGVFSFDSALLILKAGGRVTRLAWGGGNKWVSLHKDEFFLSTSDGFMSPYTPPTGAILADDWMAEHITDLITGIR